MKNFFKLLEAMRSIAIIAFVAVFGFSMITCSDGGGNPGPNPGPGSDPGPSEEQQWGDYWYYEYNGEITITRYEGTGDNVTIPAQINGKPVTSIGTSAFYNCTSLTSVTIPNSVTIIGIYAFENCTSLTSITIPNSVTSIETGAFDRCTSLTSVTIPDSVTSIGELVFQGCSSLATINVDPANTAYISEDGVLYNKNKTTLIQYPAKKQAILLTSPTALPALEITLFGDAPALPA
jgi:hypothetical protein